MGLSHYCMPCPLLLVALFIGCDSGPLDPSTQGTGVEAPSAAASRSTGDAPSSTSAVAISESRINVGWQDNSTNESGFEVHRSTNGSTGTFTLRTSTGAGVTSYSDAGLTHSTQHCYKVRAFRITGRKTSYSQFSATACATTPAPPPPAAPSEPSDANATPGGSTGVSVSWTDNSSNEDGFRVERSLDLGVTWTTAATAGPNESYVFDGGRTSEQQVCYRIAAFNAGADSPASNTDCTTPPAAPTNLIFVGAADGLTFDLTWTDNSAVEDGYEVIWCGSELCGRLATLPPDETSYHYDGGDYIGPADWYGVMATKDNGNSDMSNRVTATFPAAALGSASIGSTTKAPAHSVLRRTRGAL